MKKYQYINLIKTNPKLAYQYARDIIKGRWIEAEEYIKKDPTWTYVYASNIIKGRWREAEHIFRNYPDNEGTYFYKKYILKISPKKIKGVF